MKVRQESRSQLKAVLVLRLTCLYTYTYLGMLDELASLNVSETEIVDSNGGPKESDAATDEPARWRPRVTLRRY
jgi:hypothetical protein